MHFLLFITLIFTVFSTCALAQTASLLPVKSDSWIEFNFDFIITPPLDEAELEWYNSDFSPDKAAAFGQFIGQDLFKYDVTLVQYSFVYTNLETLRFATYWDASSANAKGYQDYRSLLGVLNNSGYAAIKLLFDKSLNEERTHRFSEIIYDQRYYPATCFNGLRDDNEVGIDCANDCPRCQPGQRCTTSFDCAQYSTCVPSDDFDGDAVELADRPVAYETDPNDPDIQVCTFSTSGVPERNWSGYSTSSSVSLSVVASFVIAFAALLF